MPQPEDVDKVETVFNGRVITVNVEQVRLPNGLTGRYEIIHHPGGAAVVAVDAANRVCLLRQFRPAGGGWVWELPAGRLEPGETPESTARRELVEEAGREALHWQSLGSILSSPGVLAETIHLFLAHDLTEVPLAHEAHEVMEIHWVGMAEALRRALSGDLRDSKTVVGLLRANARLQGKPET